MRLLKRINRTCSLKSPVVNRRTMAVLPTPPWPMSTTLHAELNKRKRVRDDRGRGRQCAPTYLIALLAMVTATSDSHTSDNLMDWWCVRRCVRLAACMLLRAIYAGTSGRPRSHSICVFVCQTSWFCMINYQAHHKTSVIVYRYKLVILFGLIKHLQSTIN